jgi:translation elongation factor EF-Tu-like GTPase
MAFCMRVLSAYEVPGRGIVAYGTVQSGEVPPVGTPMMVASDNRHRAGARLSGRSADVGPSGDTPRIGLLLEGLAESDVPEGAVITADTVPGGAGAREAEQVARVG